VLAIRCTVRGCDLALEREGPSWRCARGHTFDASRSGYVNLLQPQDRRSAEPGDSPESLAARVRWLDRGFGDALFATVAAWVEELALPEGSAILDVGCGDGRLLERLAPGLDRCGVDLSVAALRRAARRLPSATWLACNADRRLPFFDRSFAAVLSIFGRRHADEIARVLGPHGALIVSVPAEDDLVELRAAVLGEARAVERVERTVTELASRFTLVRRETVRERAMLDADSIQDALAMSYRGARTPQRGRAVTLAGLDVTLAAELLLFAVKTAESIG
jgi:23S rRNA (guanine745-N1)-methyltransferase